MPKIIIPYTPRYPQTEIHPQLESHRFNVLVTHRQMGKTVCAVNHIIKCALTLPRNDGHYFYVAPYLKQAEMLAWDYVHKFLRPIPGVSFNDSKLTAKTPNGSTIKLLGADNPDAIRGTYADGVVLDEYGDIKPYLYDEIIRPMLLEHKGWALFFGTPKGQNQFYDVFLKASAEYNKNPKGEYWAGVYRADQTGVIDPEELEKIKNSTPENTFRQEYLCDFAASAEDCVFSQEVLDQARKAQFSHPGGERVAGLDVARFGSDYAVLYIFENCGAFKWRELDVQSWNGKDTMYTVGRVVDAVKRLKLDRIIVDDDGVGGGVVDRLKEIAHDFKVVRFNGGSKAEDEHFVNKRAESYFGLKDWLEQGGVQLANETALTELATITYAYTSLGKVKLFSKEEMKAKGGKSPDFADAVMMCSTLFKTSSVGRINGGGTRVLTADANIYF